MMPNLGGVSFINPADNISASVVSMFLPEPLEFHYIDHIERGHATAVRTLTFGGAEAEINREPPLPDSAANGFRVTSRILGVHGLILVDRIE